MKQATEYDMRPGHTTVLCGAGGRLYSCSHELTGSGPDHRTAVGHQHTTDTTRGKTNKNAPQEGWVGWGARRTGTRATAHTGGGGAQ